MYVNLSGLNILITGATGDVGSALVSRLCESGAIVGVHYNEKRKEAEHLVGLLEGSAHAFFANFEDAKSIPKLFNMALEALGSIEVLINAVGVLEAVDVGKEDDRWLRSWNKVLFVNLTAMAFLSKKVIQYWLEKGISGRIINVASGGALSGLPAAYASYAASKSGMISFTRSIARTYAKHKIFAYSVLPGAINSRVGREIGGATEEGSVPASADTAGRATEPRDIAPMVACLCSGLMDYASGATIDVSTGKFFN